MINPSSDTECPLCLSRDILFYQKVHGRDYWACTHCCLRFLLSKDRLDSKNEKARYDTHQNNPQDQGYRDFLSALSDTLIPKVNPGDYGLDYGSGPGPTLSAIFIENGFTMNIYDPFFAPDQTALKQCYDFITCTETVEHFYYPNNEFNCLDNLLRPGGYLGIMTQMYDKVESFADWWYLRDQTHVSLYNKETMKWIAQAFMWDVTFYGDRVILFQKR